MNTLLRTGLLLSLFALASFPTLADEPAKNPADKPASDLVAPGATQADTSCAEQIAQCKQNCEGSGSAREVAACKRGCNPPATCGWED